MATDGRSRKLRAYRLGFRGEFLASLALMLKGYRIVARRYKTKLGEIDLIEGAADMWLSRQRDYPKLSVRFDMVAVLPWRWPVHVENVFSGRGR